MADKKKTLEAVPESPESPEPVTLNEHERAQARAANDAVRQALTELGQMRAGYLEAEQRTYIRIDQARKKLTASIEAALTSRGLEVAGNWTIDFERGTLERAKVGG